MNGDLILARIHVYYHLQRVITHGIFPKNVLSCLVMILSKPFASSLLFALFLGLAAPFAFAASEQKVVPVTPGSIYTATMASDDGWLALAGMPGGVDLYQKTGSGWVWKQHIVPVEDSSVMPTAIAMNDGMLLLGDASADVVYLFALNASTGTWNEDAVFQGSDSVSGDRFGAAIAMAPNLFVIGASEKDSTGAAYIFAKQVTGKWLQVAKLVSASCSSSVCAFGASVAMNATGSVIVIGAPDDAQSRLEIFTQRTGGTLPTFARAKTLTPPSGSVNVKCFGKSVATNDNGNVIVGGSSCEDTFAVGAGAAHVFAKTTLFPSWRFIDTLSAPEPMMSDAFGTSVAIFGNTIAVGAPSSDIAATNAGAAFVYTKGASHWSWNSTVTAADAAVGSTMSDAFGSVVLLPSASSILSLSPYKDSIGAAYDDVR